MSEKFVHILIKRESGCLDEEKNSDVCSGLLVYFRNVYGCGERNICKQHSQRQRIADLNCICTRKSKSFDGDGDEIVSSSLWRL